MTSRASLHLYGEHEFAVPPLALPDAHALARLDPGAVSGLRQYAAVDLFCRRAAAVQPGFALTPANALAVANICIGLDGLPLAIELAAARLKLFGPAIMAARLQERLALLTGGPQDLPPRQRTLRDEIAWSYDLLRPEEQLLFRRLGVFAGGFTLAAAQAAGSIEDAQGLDVLDSLAALVDQSLLRLLDSAGGEPRFGMLETIREYALEQLAHSGDAEMVRGGHACFFLLLAEKLGAELDEPGDQSSAFARLQADLDNFRAAIAWSTATPPPDPAFLSPISMQLGLSPAPTSAAELAIRLAGALAWFGLTSQRVKEVHTWLAAALRRPAGSDLAQAKALWGAGTLAFFLGNYPTAWAELEASGAMYRRSGDQLGLGRVLREACIVAYAQGDLAVAERYGEESIAILRASGKDWEVLNAVDNLAATLAAQGKHAAARALFEEEYALGLAWHSTSSRGLAATGLGWLAAQQGDDTAAVAHLEHAQALGRETGEQWPLAMALNLLGEVVQRQGDLLRAASLYRESLLLAHAVGDRSGAALVLHQIGALAQVCGQHQPAARLFAFSAAQRAASGGAIFYTLATLSSRAAAFTDARTILDEGAFVAAWAQGQAMTLEQAVAVAVEALAAIAATPTPAAPETNSRAALPAPGTPTDLTTREREVLQLLAQGLSYAEIADKLVISPRTVNSHLTTIYGKIGVTSRAAAMHYALHHGL